jgi:nucleoside-diphosphate-sugar epimerase
MSSNPRPVVALTGATGFIGQRLVPLLAADGWRVRLLLRRDPVRAQWLGVDPQVVAGGLDDPASLRQLVAGVDAVVHVAGLIKATRRRDFHAVNHAGSEALADALATSSAHARFLHVSTIAAREPQLSDYAGSKRAGEDAVLQRLGDRATVLRPPAVYGPGDRESLALFKLASKRFVPMAGGPAARAAMIHVDDLGTLLVAMLREVAPGAVLTASDARPGGYSWREVLRTAALAAGNPGARLFRAPAPLLHAIAAAGDIAALLGSANMLTHQKLRELRHPDWTVPEASRANPVGWRPRFALDEGFGNAVAWYRRAGWL